MNKCAKYALLRPSSEMRGVGEAPVDLNIFQIHFKDVKEAQKNKLLKIQPIYCRNCTVILNNYSTMLDLEEYELALKLGRVPPREESKELEIVVPVVDRILEIKKEELVWVCEFCGCTNLIANACKEVKPKEKDTVLFLKEAALKEVKVGDQTIVFCIDTSGSMNVTTEVKQKIDMKHSMSEEELNMLKQFMEPGDEQQLLLGGAVSYVSRLQCVFASIESQLKELVMEYPKRRVALVFFSNSVRVISDITKGHVDIPEADISSWDSIVKSAESAGQANPIEENFDAVNHMLEGVKAEGQTALGPALLASVSIASKGIGNSVILCTDGLANRGLGNLSIPTEQNINFYKKIEDEAAERGIQINVVTIKGESCKMDIIGKLCDKTNGKLTRVAPQTLAADFANILKDETVGVKVLIRVILHKAFRFRNEIEDNIKARGSILEKSIPIATVKTKVSFEYELKSQKQLTEEGIDIKLLKVVPFQAQIVYYNNQGEQLVRLLSEKIETTFEQKVAMKEVYDLGQVHRRAQANVINMFEDVRYQEKVTSLNQAYMDLVQRPELNQHMEMRRKNQTFESKNIQLNRVMQNKAMKHEGKKVERSKKAKVRELEYSDNSDEEEQIYQKHKLGKEEQEQQ